MTENNQKKTEPQKIGRFIAVLGPALLLWTATVHAAATEWPLRFETDKETLSVYPPQIEAIEGNRAVARSAFSVIAPDGPLTFGALRYRAVVIDNGQEGVQLSSIQVTELQFPGASARRIDALSAELDARLGEGGFVLSQASFAARRERPDDAAPSERFEHRPPRVFYEESPAVLVFVDGEPILKQVEGSKHRYVANTAYFIVKSPSDDRYYLKGSKWWYRSHAVASGWRPVAASKVPRPVIDMSEAAFRGGGDDRDKAVNELDRPPKIIVATTPAELILINGPPSMASVAGTSLLYIENTENDVLFDIDSQTFYALFAGRWYRSRSLQLGDWTHVPADALPGDFAKIPENADVANVLASVPGTEAANSAVLSNAIPEVAAVSRTTEAPVVIYDGEPEFRAIEGTRVRYAVNADKTVLEIEGRYYLVDDGVWFDGPTPRGEWQVSVSVPEMVAEIPPSAPVYHVRYVYVYDYTPDIVYMGYTPGYYCSYVDGGTVVYGTGYHYRPWYRRYYFSRPITFGFGVHYHPLAGWWGFPVGLSFGWITMGWAPFPVAYFGPAGYLYGYRHGYYHRAVHGYYNGYRNGYRRGLRDGRVAGYRAVSRGKQARYSAPASIYRNREGVVSRVRPHTLRGQTLANGRVGLRPTLPSLSGHPKRRQVLEPSVGPARPSPSARTPDSRRHRSPLEPRLERNREMPRPSGAGRADIRRGSGTRTVIESGGRVAPRPAAGHPSPPSVGADRPRAIQRPAPVPKAQAERKREIRRSPPARPPVQQQRPPAPRVAPRPVVRPPASDTAEKEKERPKAPPPRISRPKAPSAPAVRRPAQPSRPPQQPPPKVGGRRKAPKR